MAAVEPLCLLMGINPSMLSKEESYILEAELLTRVYEKLKQYYHEEYKSYFRILKLSKEKENEMLEDNFVKLIIKDILSTEEYTLDGIANYVGTHEDVVSEVVVGINTTPSVTLFRKIIELHRSVRRDFYKSMMKKITTEYIFQ